MVASTEAAAIFNCQCDQMQNCKNSCETVYVNTVAGVCLTQELVNVWSRYCALHVTDPDRNTTGRQIAMAQACSGQPSHNDQFKRWSFVPHG